MTTDTFTELTPFPMPRGACPFDPPVEYAQARNAGPLVKVTLWNGRTAWFASRYDDVVQILTDPRFSANPTAENYPSPTESRSILLNSEPPALGQIDPPEHTGFRRMFAPMFTIKRIATMREKIESVVADALDRMVASGAPVDLCQAYAYPIPTTVIAHLMGVPLADHDFFVGCANARFFHTRSPEAAVRAGEQLGEYFDRLLTAREAAPTDAPDVVNRVVAEQILPGHLDHADAIVLLRNVLVNGQDTTANMIALGTVALLQNPVQLAKLIAEPNRAANTVEELLRYFTNAHYQAPRTALEDVTIGGQTIAKGEGVIASIVAANRDPAIFPEPDRLDIDRDAARHLAFGSGIHSCLGRPLARLELEVAFTRLFERVPTLRLAVPFDQLRFTNNAAQAFGIYELPVSWG